MKVIRQRDEKDCGACCLLAIIRHYKGNVSLERIRMDAKTTNDGTTALNLILAARDYGFESMGVKYDSIYEVKNLPAIAHMNLKKGYTHYEVIEKITKDKVILMDPAKGKVKMSLQEFMDVWSGVIILFYPKRNIVLLKNEVTIFNIFLRILKSEKKLVRMIILVSILIILFNLLLGYYFQMLFSFFQNGYQYKFLRIIVIIFLIFTIMKIFLTYYKTYLENHLNKNVDCLMNSDFLKYLFNLPLNCFTTRKAGEIVSRVKDLGSIKSIINHIFISSSLDLCLVVLTIPLLISISGQLFLILFIVALIYLGCNVIFNKKIYSKAYENISYEADFNNNLIEDVKLISSIKNLGLTNKILEKLEKNLSVYLYSNYTLSLFLNKVAALKNIFYELGFFIINTYAFYLIYNGSLEVINIITFNALVNLNFNHFKNVIDSLTSISFLKASIEKINDFLSLEKETPGKIEKIYGYSISFRNLKYSYNKYEYIINNFSLNISEGEFILFKGPSGTGKSTICKILNKDITDYEGNILLGTSNLKDLSLSTIKNNVLYVSQDEEIFSGTIKDNITLGKDISLADFQFVCLLCHIDELIKKRPLRYETFISSSESNLSGGEKQRIILARSLLTNFNILLLDEALSEVDMKIEVDIIKNIKKIYYDKTIIYISHKKYPKIFDKVVTLDNKNDLFRFA